MSIRFTSLSAILLAALVPAPQAQAFDGWHLESATAIPSQTATFDYVSFDAGSNRLFIGHRKEGLQVFDPVKHAVVKIIDGTATNSANGAVLIPGFDLGIANNETGTLIPFKLSTLEAGAPIKLGDELDTSHYDPVSKRLLVNMAGGADGTELVAVAVPALTEAGRVKVPAKKAEGADADGKGGLILAGQDTNKIYRIDMTALTIAATWESPACAKPTGIAVDTAAHRVFVSCRGNDKLKPALVVLNGDTGATVFSGEIGAGSDSMVFDPETKRLFSANGVSANLSVFEQVDADTYRPLETLGTRSWVKVLAMDHKAKKLYSITAEGSADASKKINTGVSPYYPNTVIPNTFTVLTFSR